MKEILLRILLVISGFYALDPDVLHAQRLNGAWEGTLFQESGGMAHTYGFRLVVNISDAQVTGYSEVWLLDNATIHAQMRMSGSLSNADFSFREEDIEKQEIVPLWEWCLKEGLLLIDTTGSTWVMEGKWKGTGRSINCDPGRIRLTRPAPEKTSTPLPVAHADTLPRDTPSAKTEVKPAPPVQLEGRPIRVQGKAIMASNTIDIFIWDTNDIDGDVLSLNFNGKWILSKYKLRRKRKVITLQLEPDQDNYLIMYAVNEGRTPPNTAAVSWVDGGRLKTFHLKSDTKSSGAIHFTSRKP